MTAQTTFKSVYRPVSKKINTVLANAALDFSGRATNIDFIANQLAPFDSIIGNAHFIDGQTVIISNKTGFDIILNPSLMENGLSYDIEPGTTAVFLYLADLNKFFDAGGSATSIDIQENLDAAIISINSEIQSIETLIESNYEELDQRVTEEEVTRALADTNLQNQINNVLSNIDPSAIDSFVEIVAAFEAADLNLNGAITNLSTALSQQISSLDLELDQEKIDRASGDAALDTRIIALEDQVGDDLQTAIISLQASIAAEELTRIAADAATLQSAKDYTNAEIEAIPSIDLSLYETTINVDSKDASTLAAANLYTDNAIAEIPPVDLTSYAPIDYVDTEIDQAVTGLQSQISYITQNTDPAAIDSLVEVVTAFQEADQNLNGAITNLSTTLSQQISSLDSELDQEKLDRASGDASLDTRITVLEDQVGDDLQTAITSLQASIASEESARVAADLDITTRIATLEEEIGDNLQQAISSLQAANATLDTRITDLEDQVGDNLQTAISQIQLDISAEATTRASADIALQANITNVQSNLSQEIIDRIAADQTLQSNIGLEATRATAVEQQIVSNLLTEKTRIDAILLSTDNLDSRLDIIEPKVSILESEMNLVESNIASEIQRAILAEGELDGRLDSLEPKVSTLETEMDAVESNLASEILRATLAENALDNRLDILEPKVSTLETKMDSVQSGLSQEVLDRQSIDLALQGQINTEKFRTDAILLASDADKDTFAEIVQLINSIDTSNDSAFASYVISNNAAIGSLDSRLDFIEPKVTTVQVDLAQEVVSRENADIVLQQQVNLSNLNIDSLESLASTQEQEIINLKKRVLELEIDQDDFLFKREKIAIQLQQDLTYVDLEYKVIPNSIVASIDRLMIYLNDDFEVSEVNNVTRITWIGPLNFTTGDEKIGLGDILKVNYKISNSVFDSAPTPLILDDGSSFTLDNGDELIF